MILRDARNVSLSKEKCLSEKCFFVKREMANKHPCNGMLHQATPPCQENKNLRICQFDENMGGLFCYIPHFSPSSHFSHYFRCVSGPKVHPCIASINQTSPPLPAMNVKNVICSFNKSNVMIKEVPSKTGAWAHQK